MTQGMTYEEAVRIKNSYWKYSTAVVNNADRVILSEHGYPTDHIKDGDPRVYLRLTGVPVSAIAEASRNFCNALPDDAANDLVWVSPDSVGDRWIFADALPETEREDRHGYDIEGYDPLTITHAGWGSATSSAEINIHSICGEVMSAEEARTAFGRNGSRTRGLNLRCVESFDVVISQSIKEDGYVSAYWDMASPLIRESDQALDFVKKAIRLVSDAKRFDLYGIANQAFKILVKFPIPEEVEVELEVGASPYFDLLVIGGVCIPMPLIGSELDGVWSNLYKLLRRARKVSRRDHNRGPSIEKPNEMQIKELESRLERLRKEYLSFFPVQQPQTIEAEKEESDEDAVAEQDESATEKEKYLSADTLKQLKELKFQEESG